MKIHTIVTHSRPHFDELLAIWMLKAAGENRFPGVRDAKIVYWSTGDAPDGRSAEEYEKEGILLIGIGGGRFDEHPKSGRARKPGETTATLVAKELGIDSDPALGQLLKFAVNVDLRGASHPFDLAALIKAMHEANPDKPEGVFDWAMNAVSAKYLEQDAFWSAKKEFEAQGRVWEIQMPNGKTVKAVSVITDNPATNKFLRSEDGPAAAVVIQMHPRGNVQIFTQKRFKLDLSLVAAKLRLAEQERKGKVVTSDPELLRSEGKVPGAEEWYYHSEGQMLLNGSTTASDVPPTKIPLDDICAIVGDNLVLIH